MIAPPFLLCLNCFCTLPSTQARLHKFNCSVRIFRWNQKMHCTTTIRIWSHTRSKSISVMREWSKWSNQLTRQKDWTFSLRVIKALGFIWWRTIPFRSKVTTFLFFILFITARISKFRPKFWPFYDLKWPLKRDSNGHHKQRQFVWEVNSMIGSGSSTTTKS